MLRNKLCDIFNKIQGTSSGHQKYCHILRNVCKKNAFEDFEIELMRCIEILMPHNITHKSPNVDRSLEFVATFIATLASDVENENEPSDTSSTEVPFDRLIRNILVYHNLENVSVRFHMCQLIDLILRNLGEDALIDNDLWNDILESLLERMKDNKPMVRLQAVKASARLQSPMDTECPVIKAFLERMYDCSPLIRKGIVEAIAPNPLTIDKIVERVRDTDYTVRLAAYRKCAKMGPKVMKLTVRQSVVFNGFNETHKVVKKCFLEDLLPKWLSAYNGDFLKFLLALKLNASIEDMEQTADVCRKVLEVFFKTCQLEELIHHLPIDENKCIPFEKLTYEAVLFWGCLVTYLRKSEKTEDYLDLVIPDLLPFTVYIERIVEKNHSRVLNYWENDEYQHILGQLLQIAKEYDLGDEVSRKALRTLILELLTTSKKLYLCNITEMIFILEKMNPILESLVNDICSVISTIREPMVPQSPTPDALRQHNYKLAVIRVKINILEEECNQAVKKSDFAAATLIKEQLKTLEKELKTTEDDFNATKTLVKTVQNDSENIIRSLDIFIGILTHPNLRTLTDSLRNFKDQFVVSLYKNKQPEIYLRVFKCICICSSIDRQLARESLQLICSPIILYSPSRLDEQSKQILLVSIGGVSDIIRVHGANIFLNNDATVNTTSDTTISRRLKATKRLYGNESSYDQESFDFESITCRDMIDRMVDMLNDEHCDVRERACIGLCKVLLDQIVMSADVMALLLIKWFNPMTEKQDNKLQHLLGITFLKFASLDGATEIIEQTVIPVLSILGKAPKTSPLVDVDIESVLRFLSTITLIDNPQRGFVDTHKNLAYSLCGKILSKPDDACVPLFIKMLRHLDLQLNDPVVIKELIHQVQVILEDVNEIIPKRNLQKFLSKLNQSLADAESSFNVEEASCNIQQNENDMEIIGLANDNLSIQTSSTSSLNSNDSLKCRGRPKKANSLPAHNLNTASESLNSTGQPSKVVDSPSNSLKSSGRGRPQKSRPKDDSPTTLNSSDSSVRRGRPKKVVEQNCGGKTTRTVELQSSSDTDAPQRKTRRRSERKRRKRNY